MLRSSTGHIHKPAYFVRNQTYSPLLAKQGEGVRSNGALAVRSLRLLPVPPFAPFRLAPCAWFQQKGIHFLALNFVTMITCNLQQIKTIYTLRSRAILGSVSRRSIHRSCLLWDRCVKIEKRASQALGAALCAPVRVVPLGGIAVPAVACGLWRTSWAVKIGAGRHGGAYCGPGGGLRVG